MKLQICWTPITFYERKLQLKLLLQENSWTFGILFPHFKDNIPTKGTINITKRFSEVIKIMTLFLSKII